MGHKLRVLMLALFFHVVVASKSPLMCPTDPNCICGGFPALDIKCNIHEKTVEISLLPDEFINIKCINVTTLDYSLLPKCANQNNTYKSVSFKDCPVPETSFKQVLTDIGVSKTLALIFQNANRLPGYLDRRHFTGLQNLTKLLISVKGLAHLPENVFEDINKLQWLNIKSNSLNLTQELFKPLGRLETLEISHNQMSNASSNLFSHLSLLKKLSLWQSNVSWFSKDLFAGAEVLEELDLSSNGLDELPESIFTPLKKLKKLTLFSNKFSSLPQNLFQSNDELETVIMLNNDVELRELSPGLFGNLPKMKQVYLQKCGLEDVPYNLFKNSSKITIISLAYNNIRTLPEPIFNDQINLLELDLSSNQLESLGPKLFSSLVRLEKLNLAYNKLVKINGCTFAPLLSLIVLDISHNHLQIITSFLFAHNKPKMSISMAYNKLDLENEKLENNTWQSRRVSPFAFINNMRILNLSHNEFKHTFKDWWVNGHDVLDISYNDLAFLRTNEKEPAMYVFKDPINEVYISNNRFECSCVNNEVVDFLRDELKTKIPDFRFDCPFWTKGSCEIRRKIMIAVITFTVIVCVVTIARLLCEARKDVFLWIKKICYKVTQRDSNKKIKQTIVIEYVESDEEFVFKEILPDLKQHLGLHPLTHKRNNLKNKQICLTVTNPVKKINNTFVIFSPNYLTSHYGHVNIKKIRGEMMKAKETIYVFVDNGSENTVHAFLKEQRDPKTTLDWNESFFWMKVKDISTKNHEIDHKPKSNWMTKLKSAAKKIRNKVAVRLLSSKPKSFISSA